LIKSKSRRLKVLAIVNKDLETASTRFRLVQYLDFFNANGIDFDFVTRKAIDRSTDTIAPDYDVVFNQKSLFNLSYAKKIMSSAKRTIFDFDDAIYTREKKPYFWITRIRVHQRLHLWLKNATVVTTANRFLADYALRFSNRVKVIPMALDMDIWKPIPKTDDKQHLTMGWAGAPVNIGLIEQLDPVFVHLATHHPELKLAIFSGQRPRLSCAYEYHPYTPGGEVPFVQHLDIGLLPLTDEEFYRGKSPIKAIQYMACGIPVVGNIIGATREILNPQNSLTASNHTQWIDAISRLAQDKGLRQSLGRHGREHVLLNHNFQLAARDLLHIISPDRPV
jgi:glycosyltransferase involved in cell wall biosynthesis